MQKNSIDAHLIPKIQTKTEKSRKCKKVQKKFRKIE
jgi:hypothetical protein